MTQQRSIQRPELGANKSLRLILVFLTFVHIAHIYCAFAYVYLGVLICDSRDYVNLQTYSREVAHQVPIDIEEARGALIYFCKCSAGLAP